MLYKSYAKLHSIVYKVALSVLLVYTSVNESSVRPASYDSNFIQRQNTRINPYKLL